MSTPSASFLTHNPTKQISSDTPPAMTKNTRISTHPIRWACAPVTHPDPRIRARLTAIQEWISEQLYSIPILFIYTRTQNQHLPTSSSFLSSLLPLPTLQHQTTHHPTPTPGVCERAVAHRNDDTSNPRGAPAPQSLSPLSLCHTTATRSGFPQTNPRLWQNWYELEKGRETKGRVCAALVMVLQYK